MKDTFKELFLQSQEVLEFRYITRLNEECRDCDPTKIASVKSRRKRIIDEEFNEKQNDERMAAICSFLQFFEEQIDQFASRKYEENLTNAKTEFEKYYVCCERRYYKEKGLLFDWSDERIIYELGTYKRWLELSKLPIENTCYDYLDESFDENAQLFPTTPPILIKSNLVAKIEEQIAHEKNETEKLVDLQQTKEKINFTFYPQYNFLIRFREKLIDQAKRIEPIEVNEFLKILYDKPTDKVIDWIGHMEDLAFIILNLHSRLALTPTFYGIRKRSINYEKWASCFTIKSKPINHKYLKEKICDVRRENYGYEKQGKQNPKYKSILATICAAEVGTKSI